MKTARFELVDDLLIPKELVNCHMSPKKIGGEFLFKKSPLIYDREMLELWRKRFIEVGDPTEYQFGISVAGDFKAYERIKKNSRTLREYLEVWHQELEVKLRSDAMNRLLKDVSDSSSKSATSSAKYIEDKLSKHKEARRPTKKEQATKKDIEDQLFGEVEEEYERVLGSVN